MICAKSLVTTSPVGTSTIAGTVMPRRVVREPGEVGVLQPLDAEHRVDAAGVEVEGPAALVVGRAADAHRERVLEPEQPPHDDRAVRPRARPGDDEPVAAGLDGIAVAPSAVMRVVM